MDRRSFIKMSSATALMATMPGVRMAGGSMTLRLPPARFVTPHLLHNKMSNSIGMNPALAKMFREFKDKQDYDRNWPWHRMSMG